jgi:hypothetical protein
MRDMTSKCIGAAASVLMTAAMLVSLNQLAEASGVPSWIKAAESHAASMAAESPAKPDAARG